MAESYRGLTIRIGGDTSKLSQALRTANQAIAGTQSGLKKLSDALKMDPTSIKAAQLQVGAFAEQASNAATRLVDLNRAMQQVGDKIPEGASQTIREMAAGWDNVQMKAAQARDYYNELTKSLATSYTELSNLSSEAARLESVKLGKDWTITTNIEQMVQEMQAVPESFRASDAAIETFKKNVENLQESYSTLAFSVEAYQEAFAKSRSDTSRAELSQKIVKARQEMDKLQESFIKARDSFTTLSGVTFKFDKNDVDIDSLVDGLKDIVAAGATSEEQAGKMIAEFEAAKAAWIDAKKELNIANEVAQFTDLEAETAKAEAKIKSLVDEMERLAKVSTVAKGMIELEQKLSEITERGSDAKKSLENVLQAISHDKERSNQALQTEGLKAYSDAVTAAKQKVETLQQQIAKYDDAEVIALSKSMRYLNEGLEESTEEWRNQATAVQTYQAMLNDVTARMNDIKGKDPEAYEDNTEYKRLYEQSLLLASGMERVKESESAAKEEMDKFVQATELRGKVQDLELAKDAVKQLAEINIKPEVDLSAVDGLKKALEAISNGTFNADGLAKFKDGVKQASDSLTDAEKRYKALSEAAKKDPTNSETLRMRTAAFDEVVQATVAHIDAMKAELNAIPSDKVDRAALAAGKADEAYNKAKEEVDRWKNSLIDVNKRIDELTKERDSIKIVTPEDKQRVDELNQSLDELKQRRAAIAATGDAAFDNLVVEENTRRVQEHSVAIQQDEARLHELGKEAREAGSTDATPKIDEAAFMQVVDRVAQAARRMASEIVQASDQIDSAYRDMRKTVNGTEEDFVRLRDAAIEYSQHSITSADQMLEMQALGGQLGVAVENLEKFGKITSSLDIATDLDAETVALKLGQISNVLGLDIEGTQGFADALVRLGNNMPAQESSIMAVAQRFGAVAATASFSGDEILGWSAAIAATGQRSEAAATAISNTVSGIEQAVANGGSDLKQFAAIASMSAEEFKQSWKDSPTETLRAFIDGLKTLKDSDESAVAALENMGITGVRQQQTLLALTQTIGNLDDALAMSRDAWNGISDQWGQAGDAAIEAGEKSKGFSGALQIMKNNAENLAAALGDGMIPFMKAAASIMGIVTDALNAMPQPIKELVVTLGAAGIAFSALNPMLTVFGKGIGGAIASFAQAASIGDFIVKITGVEGALMGAAEQGVNLVSLFNGPMIAAIAAVAVAFGLAISAINDYSEKQEQFQQATIGLTTATQAATAGYDEYVAGAQESARSVGELKTALEEATEAQANLASKMQDAWSGIGASEATVDMMVDKITELSGKTGLTTEEQNELNAAVETFNNLTGNNVQVLDGENGTLDTTTEALRNMAQGWKDATESAQHLEDYGDAAQALAEKQKLLDEVQSKLGDSSREQGQWFTDMRDTANSATGAYDGLAAQAQKLEQEIEALKSKMKESVSGMGDLGDQVARVEDAFLATGDSLSNYGDFTDSELRAIVEAFNNAGDGSISALERVKQAIEGLRSGANEAGDIARQLEEASKEANKKEANEYKTRAKEEYNAHKAELDAAYNDAKRSYDAMYKAQKNAFDAQYNSAKRHYDKVYNAQKNAYDKQYKQLKNKLDNELRELKNANDRKLKELKNHNDAEEREFKNATDAYLHELEKRYKAAVKTAEDETDVRIKAIDEQIRALKGQTTAEQNAIKEMKEDDKIAELRKAVDQAKSRRKREEAEKKLNDYILEVQADRNERERKEQIEALELEKQDLKDALSDKKDDIKASYEEEKYQYKTSRDEKLEQIKLANDAEYDLLKAQLDEQEELRKQNHEAQLDKMKERQAERLEALKAQQTEDLEAMKTDQEAQLDAMKTRADIALENMKAAHTAELQQMQADQAAMYEMIKNGEDEVSTEIDTKQKERNANTKANAEQSAKDVGDATHGGIERLRAELEAGAPKVKTYADKLAEAGKDGPSRLREALPKFAAEGAAGLAANLENGIPHTKSAGGNLAKYATESAAKMVLDLGKVGTGGASELSKNLDSGKDSAGKSGEQLKESVKDGASQLVDDLGDIGTSGTSNLAEGIEKNESEVENAASSAADAARTPLDELSSYSYMWGYELVSNFASGISSGVYDVGNAAYSAASAAYMYLHHSVPDKGPLADDDKWGGDLIQNLIDGMRNRERDLARQAEKMARVMEDGFNPQLTVDAAYEALDTIGKNRSKSLGSIVETNSAPNVTINLSMNLSNVSMRSDADIDRLARVLSQEMATQATRQLAGRLG